MKMKRRYYILRALDTFSAPAYILAGALDLLPISRVSLLSIPTQLLIMTDGNKDGSIDGNIDGNMGISMDTRKNEKASIFHQCYHPCYHL